MFPKHWKKDKIFTGVCNLNADVSKHSVLSVPPIKLEHTECSEMLTFKQQTPVNHTEESIQYSEEGESLKSRIKYLVCV
jgi:hypothetical protein